MKRLSIVLVLLLMVISITGLCEEGRFKYDSTDDLDKVLYNYLGDQNLDISYIEDTPINKLYIVRALLASPDSPEHFQIGINYLNHILRIKGLTPAARQNLEDANRILRRFDDSSSFGRLFDTLTGKKKLVERHSFIVAQFFINEAIMNSRIILNASSSKEKVFVEKLFANYFFPAMSKNIKILYPDKSVYSFDKWKVVSSILTDVLKLNRADQLKLDVIRGKSEFVKSFIDALMKVTEEEVNKVEYIEQIKNEAERQGLDPRMIDEIVVGSIDASPRLLDVNIGGASVGIGNEQKKDLLKLLFSLYKGYSEGQKIPEQDVNDAREKAMLMQLIADPGSVSVDPQLRMFAENLKVEITLGADESEDGKFLIENLKDLSRSELSESCMKLGSGESSLAIDMHCLTGRSQEMNGMNRKSIRELIFDMKEDGAKGGGKGVVRVVTGLAGEDLEWLRSFMALNKLAIFKGTKEPWISVIRRGSWNLLVKWAGGVPKNTSTYGGYARVSSVATTDVANTPIYKTVLQWVQAIGENHFKAMYDKLIVGMDKVEKLENVVLKNALSKKLSHFNLMLDIKLKKSIDSIFEKLIKLKTGKDVKLVKKLYMPEHANRLDRMFNRVAILGMLIEGAALVGDLVSITDINDKRDSLAAHLGSLLTFRLYMLEGIGAPLALFDVVSWGLRAKGYENAPRIDEVISGAISYMIAWGNGASSPTSLKAREIESAYGLPLEPLDSAVSLENYVYQYKDFDEKERAYVKATSDTIDGIGRLISGIYFLHRAVNEYKVDKFFSNSFGVRISDYDEQFIEYLNSYVKTLNRIDKVEVKNATKIIPNKLVIPNDENVNSL